MKFDLSASLTVSPDRVQHFTSDSVSLSCEGNSTEWRVKSLPENSYGSYCSSWGTVTRSTCNIKHTRPSAAVFWCESGSGEFSNAVNITIQTVSRPESSSFPVLLIIGLVCGIILVILLLLLCRFRLSKDSCFNRPIQTESTNRGSATSDMVNQNEAQRDEYSTLLHGDACLYETIKCSEDNSNGAAEYEDVTCSLIELKSIGMNGEYFKYMQQIYINSPEMFWPEKA
ncbi:uncharacterized protein LOC114545387 [Perca flavescens]|uniref:uncharacterized protein LOC114545387 n=1 Tax=Perca flavescens TaxID=8167 RepID=UPI00106DE65D|nr:uncharacterized protein LOC114545387 [Perca flavescens]